MAGGIHYIFTILPKKRRRPNPNYEGILSQYHFRIHYFFVLPDEDPVKIVRAYRARKDVRDLIIEFPVQNHDDILKFAYEIGGIKVGEYCCRLQALKQRYVVDIVGFDSIEDYQRHLVFALSTSVLRSKTKVELLKARLLTSNQGFVKLLANLAEELYKDSRRNPYWHNTVLRVGRAVRMLYGLHK